MTEYISREALLERIDAIWDCADLVFEPNDNCCRTDDCASCKWRETKNAIRKIVAYIPAADVRPVVRGKWKPDYDSTEYDFDGSTPLPEPRIFQDGWQCSLCGEYTPSKTNFCPNCGADMREES